MSIDRSNLPPKLQDLLKTLEEKGLNVEVIAGTMPPELRAALGLNTEGSSKDSRKDDCGCPGCTARRAISAGGAVPSGLIAQLEKLSDQMAARLVSSVGPMLKSVHAELQRQVEINDANMARIAELNTILNGYQVSMGHLKQEINDLSESHRKQVGLLHRRVTKRKGEIGDVKVRVATTRGRVTRVEKKVS